MTNGRLHRPAAYQSLGGLSYLLISCAASGIQQLMLGLRGFAPRNHDNDLQQRMKWAVIGTSLYGRATGGFGLNEEPVGTIKGCLSQTYGRSRERLRT